MKISLEWLSDFVTLEGSLEMLIEGLTMGGIEVEGVEKRGADFDRVVVAEILSSERHPNADKLSVCQVSTGSEKLQIVCGAKNYKVGDRVPLALAGAVLPGDFKIKESKLRGELSQGMMCSARELGLAEDAEGLFILPPDTELGMPIGRFFPPDTILDLEITPNRPDLLSHLGMARELVALKLAKWKSDFSIHQNDGLDSKKKLEEFSVEVLDPKACPLYTATVIEQIKMGLSPWWIQRRLEVMGLRSIDVLVDVTNYVMLELGQPMHVFDLDRLTSPARVQIRFAQKGEKIRALDHREYELTSSDLVIADSQHVIALAGVIGGEDSAVSTSTQRVILEVACFNPSLVRATSRRLGVITDSSYRFERKVDQTSVLTAKKRAIQLIQELTGGQVTTETVCGSAELKEPVIKLRQDRLNALLGTTIPTQEINRCLTTIGAKCVESNSETSVWQVPSFRPDLEREVDLIEEVTRLVGLEKIPSRLVSWPAASTESDRVYDRGLDLRRKLTGLGFYEVLTSPLATETESEIRLLNPMTSDQVGLRYSLISHLLQIVHHNVNQGNKQFKLFECGRVFSSGKEVWHMALVMTGKREEIHWSEESKELDVFDLRGVLTAIGQNADAARMLNATELKTYGIKQPVIVAEVVLEGLETEVVKKFQPWPIYPTVMRDLAIVVPKEIPAKKVEEAIHGSGIEFQETVKLFDVFMDETGAKLSPDRKSLAFSICYRSKDRTLTDVEANELHSQLKAHVKAQLDCEFRE